MELLRSVEWMTSNLVAMAAALTATTLLLALAQLALGASLEALVGPERAATPRRLTRRVLTLSGFALALGIVGGGAYLTYLGEDVVSTGARWLTELPRAMWRGVALSVAQAIGLLILARWFTRRLEALLIAGEA